MRYGCFLNPNTPPLPRCTTSYSIFLIGNDNSIAASRSASSNVSPLVVTEVRSRSSAAALSMNCCNRVIVIM